MGLTNRPQASSASICTLEARYVRASDAVVDAHARQLATHLQCTYLSAACSPNADSGPGLLVTPAGLALLLPGFAPLRVDATNVAVRRRAAAGRRLHLFRACGAHIARLRIVDATAGLGRDAFALAWAGAQVLMIEREPILAVLLDAAVAALAGSAAPLRTRLEVHAGDACRLLAQLYSGHDVICLDPMFADVPGGMPGREMQMLARLDSGDDGAALLAAALALRAPRVVVKRGRNQPSLGAGSVRPHHQIVGKRIRFDVYQSATLG